MKKITMMTKLLMIAAALTFGTLAYAADPAAGKEKSKVCAACHGENGNSQAPDFPKLAGQHGDYLVRALTDYKSGVRKNPIMAGQVANLKREDIADLAAYYSSQQGLATKY
ncbi:MAG: cytochrome [Betaproteobacteria bacterium]|jgi:cytochrome c553|nr:cytochrome [Betaproteobacteria bacterium]